MKSLAGFLCFVALCTNLAGAAETAYTALRVLGQSRGQELLRKVVEVRGVKGQDQPDVWRVIIEDPDARAGIREFELARGRVVSERTPAGAYAGMSDESAMDFGRLNLDSSGAFSVAEKEAAGSQVGFDSVDYILTAGEDKRPVWMLILLDESDKAVGKIQISAEDGRILRREGFEPGESASGEVVENSDTGHHGGGIKGKLDRFGRKVHRRFLKDTATIERFFTGKSRDEE